MTEQNTQTAEEATKEAEKAKAAEEARKQAEINHVKSEISRIFGDTDVQHYEQLGSKGQHYQIFENHDAVYCALHISNENHTQDDFWHAIAMAEAQKSTIAIRYHETEGEDSIVDRIVDQKVIDDNGREETAAKLFYTMRDEEKYLTLVRVPFDYQKERYDKFVEQNSKRLTRIKDHKELASEMAIGIAALIRYDWGIQKVEYDKKSEPENDAPAVEETVPQTCQELSPNDALTA